MRGVKAIGGISEIKAGKMVTFYVKNWYPNTPKQDKDPAKVKWELYEKKGSNLILKKTFKEGKLQFSENEIGKQYIVVGYLYEPELNNASAMKISVIPTEKVQILSVEVRDINGNKITKPLAYGQKIKVNVRTTGLQGAKLNIDLWEDDETGGGHDDKNTKVSVASQLVPVGKNGIATTEMLIPVNFKKYAEAHGDKGKDNAEHEYYVTAYHDGTQREASGNINFTNTKTPTQRKEETRDHLEQKPKRTEPVRGHRGRARKDPPTPTPSRSTPAPASPPAQQQPSQPRAVKKEITTVYITDANDKKISGTVKSGIVKVHILSTGLVGRDIRFKFYEEDVTENELVFEQKFKITKDHFIVDVTLNKVSANKGDDYFEGSEQEFFVDIEVLDTHAHIKSAVIDVDVKALKQDIPTNVTKTKVEQQEAGKNQSLGICVCKTKALYWGKKFTCAERKKIFEISNRLGCNPDYLTSAMGLETGGKFDPSIVNSLGYTGLIQIGEDAANDINRRKNTDITAGKNGNLKKMSVLEQLTYVEYYLEPFKGKLNTLADFYLAILMPVDCGKGNQPNHIVFDKSLKLDYNKNGKVIKNTKWVRQRGYESNPAFHTKGKEDGKTYVSEIANVIQKWYDEGAKFKESSFNCQQLEKTQVTEKNVKWYDPIDNPQITLFNFYGNFNPKGSSFGMVRNGGKKAHQGLDLFAPTGTDVKACLDGTVVLVSESAGGYGKFVVIEVKKDDLDKCRKEYKLKYDGEQDKGINFGDSNKRYLRYGHLSEIEVSNKQFVKAGQKIGESGNSGNAKDQNVRARHLHFEISDSISAGKGLQNRENPAFYVNLTTPNRNEQENNNK